MNKLINNQIIRFHLKRDADVTLLITLTTVFIPHNIIIKPETLSGRVNEASRFAMSCETTSTAGSVDHRLAKTPRFVSTADCNETFYLLQYGIGDIIALSKTFSPLHIVLKIFVFEHTHTSARVRRVCSILLFISLSAALLCTQGCLYPNSSSICYNTTISTMKRD